MISPEHNCQSLSGIYLVGTWPTGPGKKFKIGDSGDV
jgi:hypothetical protein